MSNINQRVFPIALALPYFLRNHWHVLHQQLHCLASECFEAYVHHIIWHHHIYLPFIICKLQVVIIFDSIKAFLKVKTQIIS